MTQFQTNRNKSLVFMKSPYPGLYFKESTVSWLAWWAVDNHAHKGLSLLCLHPTQLCGWKGHLDLSTTLPGCIPNGLSEIL